MSDADVLRMLENALDDQSTYLDDEATPSIMGRMSVGVRDMDDQADLEQDIGGHEFDDDFDDDNASEVQLPAYPTPYEVWQSKHPRQQVQKKAIKLSKEEMDGVVSRLNDSGRKKHEILATQQHKQIAEEIKNASFAPKLNNKSRELNQMNNVARLPERQDALLAARDAQLKKQRELKVEKELCEMRDAPDTARSHSSWERIKQKQGIVTSKDTMNQRGVGNLLKYGKDKQTRLLQRRQIAHETEDREATFTPQINQHSLRLHKRMIAEGRDVRRDQPSRSGKKKVVVGGTGTSRDPGHEEEKFKPQINSRSKKVPVDGDPYTRLYDKALEKTRRKKEQETQLLDSYVQGIPGVGTTKRANERSNGIFSSTNGGNKSSQANGYDSHFNSSVNMVHSVLSADPSALLSGVNQYSKQPSYTAIDYNPSMDFIFQLFGTSWPRQN